MEAVVAAAIESIDLRRHQGVHPRIGAVDVVPFVPLEGSSMATQWTWRAPSRPRSPSGTTCPCTSTRRLPQRRRAGSSRISASRIPGPRDMDGDARGTARLRPRRPHPSAGATVVGARPVLIAWNIQLEAADVGLAKRIAARIRERGGGLPGVQALGFYPGRGRRRPGVDERPRPSPDAPVADPGASHRPGGG